MTSDIASTLAALGLRGAALAAAFGARTALHLARATSGDELPQTRAAAAVALFVQGRTLPAPLADALLGDPGRELTRAGLLARDGESLRAPLAVLPIETALVLSPWSTLPDDSSLHLRGCLPARSGRWLDVGTGCGFLPIVAHRSLHGRGHVATDIDAAALAAAVRGLELAGIADRVSVREGDLFGAVAERGFDLITFNAPIEGAHELLERFYAEAPGHLASGGEILVHSVLDAEGPAGGSLWRCAYTPPTFEPTFGITRWHPDATTAPPRWRRARLSPGSPHLARTDLEPTAFSTGPVSR